MLSTSSLSEIAPKPKPSSDPAGDASRSAMRLLQQDIRLDLELDQTGVLSEITEEYRLGLASTAKQFEFLLGPPQNSKAPSSPKLQNSAMMINDTDAERFSEAFSMRVDPNAMKKKQIRVYVCSNHADMEIERRQLGHIVFPEIRKHCYNKGIHFMEVDFNWGSRSSDSEKRELLACYQQEVQNCLPFFICMLGQRQGYTFDFGFTAEEVATDPLMSRKEAEKCSLREMEITLGPLKDVAKWNNAFFYFRDAAYASSVPEEEKPYLQAESAEALENISALKDRIRKTGCNVKDNYANPEEFAALVLKDLTTAIERIFPSNNNRPSGWISPDGNMNDFLHSQIETKLIRDAWVAAAAYEAIDHHVLDIRSHLNPIVITGQVGCGKSSLLASWKKRFLEQNECGCFISHYCSVAPNDTWIQVVQRICVGLKGKLRLRKNLPTSVEEFRGGLQIWCQAIAECTSHLVVLMIDGIDEVVEVAATANLSQEKTEMEVKRGCLSWLPQFFASGIRVVISATTGSRAHQVLVQERHWTELSVPTLAPDVAKSVVREYQSRYGLKCTRSQLAELFASNAIHCSFCLTSSILVAMYYSEHNMAPDFKTIGDMTTIQLCQHMLIFIDDNMKEPHLGSRWEALCLLAVSRFGLQEYELVAMMQIQRAAWSPIYQQIQHFVVTWDGMLSFVHQEFCNAVYRCYLPTSSHIEAYRNIISNYFTSVDCSPRKVVELPWQLLQLQRWNELLSTVIEHHNFAQMRLTPEGRCDLVWFTWAAMESIATGDALLERIEENVSAYKGAGLDELQRLDLMHEYAAFLLELRNVEYANTLMKRVEEQTREDTPAWVTVRRLETKAVLQLEQRMLTEAFDCFAKCLSIISRYLSSKHPEYQRLRREQINVLVLAGDVELMNKECEEMISQSGPTALALESTRLMMHAHISQGRYSAAEDLMQRLMDSNGDPLHPDLSPPSDFPLHRVNATTECLRFLVFMKLYGKVIQIVERENLKLFVRDEAAAIVLYDPLLYYGLALTQVGRTEDADQIFKELLATRIAGDGIRRARTLDLAGINMRKRGEFNVAEQLHKTAVTIRVSLEGSKHPVVGPSLSELARIMELRHEYTQAYRLRLSVLHMWQSKVHNSSNLALMRCLHAIAILYWRFGASKRAFEIIDKVSFIVETGFGVESQFMASVYLARGLAKIGLEKYEEAQSDLQRAQRAAIRGSGPSHSDLLDILSAKGEALVQQGMVVEAEELLRQICDDRASMGGIGGELNDLVRLAVLFFTVGAYPETETVARRCLQLAEEAYGSASMQYIRAKLLLAVVCHQTQTENAEMLAMDALATRKSSCGNMCKAVVQHKVFTALFMHGIGQLDKAVECYQSAYNDLSHLSEAAPARSQIYANLWMILQGKGSTDQLPKWVSQPAPRARARRGLIAPKKKKKNSRRHESSSLPVDPDAVNLISELGFEPEDDEAAMPMQLNNSNETDGDGLPQECPPEWQGNAFGIPERSVRDAAQQFLAAIVAEDQLSVEQLVEAGLDIDSADEMGNSGLHFAAAHDLPHMAHLLLRLGATPDLTDIGSSTPLHVACSVQSLGVFKLLVPRVRDTNAQDGRGDTPLHIAARFGWLDAVKLLVERYGAQPNLRNFAGKTAAHCAIASGESSVLEYLRQQMEAMGDSSYMDQEFLAFMEEISSPFGRTRAEENAARIKQELRKTKLKLKKENKEERECLLLE